MSEFYTMKIAGLERKLELFPVSDKLDIAAFIIFGDVELTVAGCAELLKKVPEFDVVLTPEATAGADDEDLLEDAMNILRSRLDDKGYTEAVISIQDGNKIRVEVPQVEDDGTVENN